MFYEQLDFICKRRGKTVTGLAKELGISTSNVTNWKNGTIPKGEVIIRLAEVLNTSCDYLLLGIEAPAEKLTENEKDILLLLNQLSERNQIRLIGNVEQIVKEINQSNAKENVG